MQVFLADLYNQLIDEIIIQVTSDPPELKLIQIITIPTKFSSKSFQTSLDSAKSVNEAFQRLLSCIISIFALHEMICFLMSQGCSTSDAPKTSIKNATAWKVRVYDSKRSWRIKMTLVAVHTTTGVLKIVLVKEVTWERIVNYRLYLMYIGKLKMVDSFF